jgi:hypothetical protein
MHEKLLKDSELLPYLGEIRQVESKFTSNALSCSFDEDVRMILSDNVYSCGIVSEEVESFIQVIAVDEQAYLRFCDTEYEESNLLGLNGCFLYICSAFFKKKSHAKRLIKSLKIQYPNWAAIRVSFFVRRDDLRDNFIIQYGFKKIDVSSASEYSLYSSSGSDWLCELG